MSPPDCLPSYFFDMSTKAYCLMNVVIFAFPFTLVIIVQNISQRNSVSSGCIVTADMSLCCENICCSACLVNNENLDMS